MIKQTFGDDILDGFKGAFLSTLGALSEKDENFLNNILEANLLKGISYRECQLVHENSPV